MKVYWTDLAKTHLREIERYISRSSAFYAKRTIDKLLKRSVQVDTFPLSGRIVPEFGIEQIREVIEDPYRIVYYIKPDQIDVLAVIHGASDILREITDL